MQFSVSSNGMAADTDFNGRDQTLGDLTLVDLQGTSSMGPVRLQLRDEAFYRSYGQIEERVNSQPGLLELPPFVPVMALLPERRGRSSK